MAALVPSIAADFSVSADYALKLTWLYMLPYGIVALIWAPLSRVAKIKQLLLCASAGFFISTVLFSFSQSIEQAFIFRFLMGCFGCSFVPLSLITISKTVEPKDKAKYVGIFFGLAYLSTFFSVLLSGFISWRIIYLVPAILSLVVFVLILTHLNDFDFRKSRFKISYLETLKDPKSARFFLVIILGSCLYHALQQRFGVYLNQVFSLEQMTISLVFTISTLCAIGFEFSGGFLSSNFGNIKVARVGFILMSIFSLSLLFIKQYQLIFVFIAFWGSGMALAHVGLSAHLTHFPDRTMRDASSLNSALRFSSGGLGAFLGGALVSAGGFKLLFFVVALAILLLGLFLTRMLSEKKESYG